MRRRSHRCGLATRQSWCLEGVGPAILWPSRGSHASGVWRSLQVPPPPLAVSLRLPFPTPGGGGLGSCLPGQGDSCWKYMVAVTANMLMPSRLPTCQALY